jgi:hypothetical protein
LRPLVARMELEILHSQSVYKDYLREKSVDL